MPEPLQRSLFCIDMIDDAPCGMVATDPQGRIIYANRTLAGWMGWPETPETTPRTLADCLTMPGRIFYETHIAPMMRLQGNVREISCQLRRDGEVPMPVLLTGIARRASDGTPERHDYTIFDASDRLNYEKDLRAAQRQADQLAAIVRSSPNAILRVDADGKILDCNAQAVALMAGDDCLPGEAISTAIPLEGEDDWFAALQRAPQQDAGFEARGPGGVDFEVNVCPIEDRHAPADMCDWSVILRDITPRKQAERRLEIVAQETRHRLKNTMAIISGIARQTLPAEVSTEFTERLKTLAHAHDMLMGASWTSARLSRLLDFTAQSIGGEDRFRISGADLTLSPQETTTLSMVLHELVTNAMKYGALSVPEGHVSVDCTENADEPGRFTITWQERGGPRVTPPDHKGFGSKMIEMVARMELAAEDAAFEFLPEGVRWVLSFRPRTAA